MNEDKLISEQLYSLGFIKKLMQVVHPIYFKHLTDLQHNHNVNLDDYGTYEEKYLKSIYKFVDIIKMYINDLSKTLAFLKVDRKKIPYLYEEKITIDEYYKYHYDNFVIRIVTSIDICAKMGNIIYDLNMPEKKVTWYSVAEHPKIKNNNSAKKLEDFAKYLESFKKARNLKVHKGMNPDNVFDNIIFSEVINKLLGKKDIDNDPYEKYTDRDITNSINEIEKTTQETAEFIFAFLESMTYRLEEIINDTQ